ncbi:hypothetical protein D3G64_14780 [Escherichia coli]|nr:hypothetical protein [Escherichia coli]
MSVIQWWLTYFYNAASEYLISTRQMSCRFIKSTNSGLFLKLLSSSDLLSAYSALFDHGLAAFFKVVVAFCNKITLCSLFFWIQVDF